MTNLWKDWVIRKSDKEIKNTPRPVREMRLKYGKNDEHKCGDCVHLRLLSGYAGRYYKCELSKLTHGSATDWRKKWQACGKWQERGDQ